MEKWIKFLQPYGVAAMCGLLMAVAWPLTEGVKTVEASPVKVWSSNEYIRYSDLNAVISHLHANLGHGHGAIITANDIASNAAIRPEQTTFGSSVNRTLVAVGTWEVNPDAGAFLPINTSGELELTITPITGSGFNIDGAAGTGALSDAGTDIYTVFYKAVGFEIGDTGLICTDQGSTVSLSSPLHIAVDCFDLTDATPPSNKVPNGVAVQVFSNKVQ